MAQLGYYNDDITLEEFDEDAFWSNDACENVGSDVPTQDGFEPSY